MMRKGLDRMEAPSFLVDRRYQHVELGTPDVHTFLAMYATDYYLHGVSFTA